MAHIDGSETQRANVAFIKRSMREPLLSRDREFHLARRWRENDDEDALHELVRAYTRLVISTRRGSATTACRWAIWCRKAMSG